MSAIYIIQVRKWECIEASIIELGRVFGFPQKLPEHNFLLIGIFLYWTSMWVFITCYRGTLGKVVKVTCSQDDLHPSAGARVLQVSDAPPLALHPSECLLNDGLTPADVGVVTKVCVCESPDASQGGDDEGESLTDVSSVPQQTVLPHLLLPFLEKCG